MTAKSYSTRSWARSRGSHTYLIVASLLALALTGCGKTEPRKKAAPPPEAEASAAPAPEAKSPPPDPCERPPGLLVLDNFEDGDNTAIPLQGGTGGWFISTDGTANGVIYPPLGPANPERLQPPRCGSSFALHLRGQGFRTWGAVVSVTPRFQRKAQPVNLGEYRGMRFWVRAGNGQLGALRLKIDDANTHPDGGRCAADGGSGGCWNAFGIDMPTIDADWQEKVVLFDSLTQSIPESAPQALDRANIYTIGFRVSPGNPFDIWIDDPSFFR